MSMLSIAVRGLAARRGRLILASSAVVIGVAFLVGTLVLTDGAARGVAADDARGIRTAFLLFGSVALFVATLVIRNTFATLVAQRTRELAVLRSLGASKRQVLTSVVVEAVIVGALSSAVGLASGTGLARVLGALAERFDAHIQAATLTVLPRTVLVAFAVGTLTTVVAAVAPAVRASRVAPVAAVRTAAAPTRRLGRTRTLAGAIVGTVGTVASMAGSVSANRVSIALGAVAIVTAVILLMPTLTTLTMWTVAKVPNVGTTANLAVRNVLRDPRRTTATAGALTVGVALVTFGAIVSGSVAGSARAALGRTVVADSVVVPIDGHIEPRELASLLSDRGVEQAFVVRRGSWRAPGGHDERSAVSLDPEALGTVLDLDLLAGDVTSLADDAVLVGDAAARHDGLSVGESMTMTLPAGERTVVVGGIFRESYGTLVTTSYVLGRGYDTLFGDDRSDTLLVDGRADAVRDVLGPQTAQVMSARTFIAGIADTQSAAIDQVLGLLTSIVAVSVLVALLGIANTLSLSVIERAREFGLLRAIGMDRRGVGAMVAWEAALIAIQGSIVGIALGTFAAWALASARTALVDTVIVPFDRLLAFAAIGALTGLAAATAPAARATRTGILDALARR